MTAVLHALLIGIDQYARGDRPPVLYPNLQGAVRDAERIAELLVEFGSDPANIIKLTAPATPAADPIASTDSLPTYEKIVDALNFICESARPNDRVVIAFAGHGGRVPTLCPEVKGVEGLDEVLVPTDVADPQARCLRDVEIAFILRRMTVEQGLRATLILDCCHAGGLNRTASLRGTGKIDRTRRPEESLVAASEELSQVWDETTDRRDLQPASGWLPNPRGYVLLAACQAYEQASEGWFEADSPGGLFTHALLRQARRLGPSVRCDRLHEAVSADVRKLSEGRQAPQLEGESFETFLHLAPSREIACPSRPQSAFDGILRLDDPGSYLSGRLRLELRLLPADFAPDPRRIETLKTRIQDLPRCDEAQAGEKLCLTVGNDSLQPLHVSLWNHRTTGTNHKIFPADGVGESEIIAPGEEKLLLLRAWLPDDLEVGTDTIQAVAASDPSFFSRATNLAEDEILREIWTLVRLTIRTFRARE